MIFVLTAALILLVTLAAIFWSYGPDTDRLADPHARPWRRAALVILGLYTSFLAYMGIGEMIGGDMSGASHLIPVAFLAMLAYLATKRPRETGVALTVVGLAASAYFAFAGSSELLMRLPAIVFGGLPWLAAGLLLLVPELGHHSGPRNHIELGV
jgi:hypothetical protein